MAKPPRKKPLTPNQKLDKANQKFKALHNPQDNFMKHIPAWVLRKANYLETKEQHAKSNKRIFSRGELIKIDFGVNVGAEMSNEHFGIVLNKKDSPFNDLLTVVPISSKPHRGYVELKQSIWGATLVAINKELEKYEPVIQAIEAWNRAKSLLNSIKYDEPSRSESLVQLQQITIFDYQFDTHSATPLNDMLSVIKKELRPFVETHMKFTPKTDDDIDIVKIAEFALKTYRELLKFSNDLERYSLAGYVDVKNIHTISKARVLSITSVARPPRIKLERENVDTVVNAIKQNIM